MARRTGLVTIIAIVGAVLLGVLASVGAADHGKGNNGKRSIKERLIGFQEVPAVSTTGKGKIRLKLRNSTSIEYTLSYSGLTTPATQAHIHFAQRGVNGGIVLWLCDSATNNSPVADTPACPAGTTTKATVTGTLDMTDVQAILVGGLPAQGIAAGELAEVLTALKAGVTYANVHSGTFPGGEIRAQLLDRNDD